MKGKRKAARAINQQQNGSREGMVAQSGSQREPEEPDMNRKQRKQDTILRGRP